MNASCRIYYECNSVSSKFVPQWCINCTDIASVLNSTKYDYDAFYWVSFICLALHEAPLVN